MTKIALITGTSRGLGNALAHSLLKTHTIVGISRSPAPINHSNYHHVQGDVTDSDCQLRALEKLKQFNQLDVVIHNAGNLIIKKILDLTPDEINLTLQIHLVSFMSLVQKVLPILRASNGLVVGISSGASTKAVSCWSSYCIAKTALNQFISCLAHEEPDIFAISLRPGVVDTGMQEKIRNEGEMMGKEQERFLKLKEEGKLVNAEEVAKKLTDWILKRDYNEMNGKFVNWTEL